MMFYRDGIKKHIHGFTLIELLVVVSVIGLLVAIMMPALSKAKIAGRKTVCLVNLKHIAAGWIMYLDDNNEQFLQGVNVQRTYGGCRGTEYPDAERPLNKYLNYQRLAKEAEVFHCPEDNGRNARNGRNYYKEIGSSYLTNQCLIGNTSVSLPEADIRAKVNNVLPGLTLGKVVRPAEVLLLGDTDWWTQLMSTGPQGRYWHGKEDCYNMAYLDGRAMDVKIEKGNYITCNYRVLPFK